MALDEYSTGGGGKLKLKGSKVADGRVEKKKKKGLKKEERKKKEEQEAKKTPDDGEGIVERREDQDSESREDPRNEEEGGPKTETERKYEEVRRKRVCPFSFPFFISFSVSFFVMRKGWDYGVDGVTFDIVLTRLQLRERLQRDGVKTHKERVEELNKYLSRLSEHHDMYVFLLLQVEISRNCKC